MDDNEKSPVIDRLVQFIKSTGLSSSQFADKAGIPRPSLSQMLHGRNKSVNNQVLTKLNDAFPNLNILWLLFGQGNMSKNLNIEISEPENSVNASSYTEQSFDFERDKGIQQVLFNDETSSENRNVEDSTATIKAKTALSVKNNTRNNDLEENDDISALSQQVGEAKSDDSKKISSIIVLYTDGSFETFKSNRADA